MVAGAAAGVGEHVAMYPVDTIKTRMQALAHPGQQVCVCGGLCQRWGGVQIEKSQTGPPPTGGLSLPPCPPYPLTHPPPAAAAAAALERRDGAASGDAA